MPMRKTLPHRRQHEIIGFEWKGNVYHASVSKFEDGAPAELFISAGKSGSDIEALARDAAVVASLALQYGVPLETLKAAVTKLGNGKGAGPLGKLLDIL